MPRDYKHAAKGHKKPEKKSGGVLPFVTGLVLGLFIAFIVYLGRTGDQYIPFRIIGEKKPASSTATETTTEVETTTRGEPAVPGPRFDFYNVLPNREINISEWVAEEPEVDQQAGRDDEAGVYVLQVGSFKQFDAADQVKAQLALLGIVADIQRVVINGQDTRYRVRVGPYKDRNRLEAERRRLRENRLEYMILELKADDAGVAGR